MGIIAKQSVQDIANAIRNRNGLTTLYKPREMDEAILNLYSTTKVNSMLDYILPCYEKEATSYTIKYADSDRPGSITKLEGNTTQDGTPTPDNPVEIKTVSGDNEIVVSNEQHVTGNSYRVDFGGDNKLPQDKYIASTEVNGITYTNNGDGTFSLSGTATASTTIRIIPVGDLSLKTSQAYYLYSSQPYNSSTFNMSIVLNDSGTNRYLIANGTLTTPSSFTQARLQFYIASGNTVNVQNIKLMLVEGNTAPSRYSPYVSNPIELCKIGNYVDTLFKAEEGNEKYDSLDSTTKASLTLGNWYIEKNIGKVVLDGTQNITLAGSGVRRFNATYSTLGITNVKEGTSNADTSQYRKNDHFVYFSSSINTWGNYYMYSNWLVLFDSGSTIADANALKTWFTSNPTSIYYVLATPTYEIITNENLVQQLNNIQDIELIENLCYVDWVGKEKPKMKLFCYLDKDKLIEEITG